MKKRGKYDRGRSGPPSSDLSCLKCGHRGPAAVVSSGPHLKATCSKCGAYIKFLGKKSKQGRTPPPASDGIRMISPTPSTQPKPRRKPRRPSKKKPGSSQPRLVHRPDLVRQMSGLAPLPLFDDLDDLDLDDEHVPPELEPMRSEYAQAALRRSQDESLSTEDRAYYRKAWKFLSDAVKMSAGMSDKQHEWLLKLKKDLRTEAIAVAYDTSPVWNDTPVQAARA